MKSFIKFISEDVEVDVGLELPDIYLDMDETIVDWMSGANQALKNAGLPEWNHPSWKNQPPEEADKIKWDVLNSTPHFWENLDFMPDGKMIWDFVKKYKPKILSACGANAKHFCKEGKMRWLQRHLGLSNLSAVHLVPRSHKKKFAKVNNKKCILIDDYDKNCIEFMTAGGIAIQATSGNSVINQLKKIGFR